MNIGDKVHILTKGFEDEIGTIETVLRHSRETAFLVRLSDNSLIKSLPEDLEIIDETVPVSETITLSRDDFERAVSKVLTPSLYTDEISDYSMITALCLSGEIVCKKLARELFGEND